MPDIQSILKAEIARLARKEVRAEVLSLKKASSLQRSHIAALRRQVETLQQTVQRLTRGAARVATATPQDGVNHPARRFSAQRLAKTRETLGLSAADFGALIGVSGQSIYKWESGEVRPRKSQVEAIAQVRGLGKREAAARLETIRAQVASQAKPRRRAAVSRHHARAAEPQKARKRA